MHKSLSKQPKIRFRPEKTKMCTNWRPNEKFEVYFYVPNCFKNRYVSLSQKHCTSQPTRQSSNKFTNCSGFRKSIRSLEWQNDNHDHIQTQKMDLKFLFFPFNAIMKHMFLQTKHCWCSTKFNAPFHLPNINLNSQAQHNASNQTH